MERGDKTRTRGAMELSFGMIFSIILIISFLVFAFYAIKMFVNASDSAKIASFRSNFQEDINKIWTAPQGNQKVNYGLPKKITEVCIVKNYDPNLIFYPEEAIGDLKPVNLNHINITKSIKTGLPGVKNKLLDGQSKQMICFNNTKEKVSMVIKKNFGENFVTVSAN
jgi:hypothetical protein